MYHLLTAVSMAVALAGDAGQGLKPWASNKHPTRRGQKPRGGNHLRAAPIHDRPGGHDGWRELPLADGMRSMSGEGACEQTWQSNRAVRLENVGQADVVNPWLSNGRNNFRTLDEIVAAAITPGHERQGKITGPLVPGSSLSLPPRRQTTRNSATRSRSSTSTATTPAATIRSAWRGCGTRRGSRKSPPPGRWDIASPRPSSTAAGTSSTATTSRLPAARQRNHRQRPGHRAGPRPGETHAHRGNPSDRQPRLRTRRRPPTTSSTARSTATATARATPP